MDLDTVVLGLLAGRISVREAESDLKSGQAAGNVELMNTDLPTARVYAEKEFAKAGTTLDQELPNFDKNSVYLRKMAGFGKTQRKDMPQFEIADIRRFQALLVQGRIDVVAPFAKNSKVPSGNPFPEGLTGEMAKEWLEKGLHDGQKQDDIVRVEPITLKLSDLIPIQRQIYLDKSVVATAKFGVDGSVKFIQGSLFIISSDNRIIDGHHRWSSGLLIDPSMQVNCVRVMKSIDKLLPIALSFSDAIGNKRNG